MILVHCSAILENEFLTRRTTFFTNLRYREKKVCCKYHVDRYGSRENTSFIVESILTSNYIIQKANKTFQTKLKYKRNATLCNTFVHFVEMENISV